MSGAEKKAAMRTCIACRENMPKREMTLIVRSPVGIRLDFTGKAQGRGAYICNGVACVAKLKKYKLLNKTFSEDVGAETYARIEEELLANRKD